MNRRMSLPATDPPWPVHSPVWIVAILFFVVGDVVTTGVGIGMDGIVEAGPVTALLLQQYGLGVLIPLKLAVLGGCVGFWRVIPRPHCTGIPIGLAVVGVAVTGWNLSVLVSALLL